MAPKNANASDAFPPLRRGGSGGWPGQSISIAVAGYGGGRGAINQHHCARHGGGQGAINQHHCARHGGGQVQSISGTAQGTGVARRNQLAMLLKGRGPGQGATNEQCFSGQTMNDFFNRDTETDKRRELRGSMPEAEVILWSRLKGRQLLGCKFRHQYSVGSFVIDFFSVEIKLGIELDGDSRFQPGAAGYDKKRQHFIESFGIKVVRILNTEVRENLDGVLEVIGREILERRAFGKTQ